MLALAAVFILTRGKERPMLAGICLALMSVKPQVAVMIGLVMLCAGYWRALMWSIPAGVVLLAASVVAFWPAAVDQLRHLDGNSGSGDPLAGASLRAAIRAYGLADRAAVYSGDSDISPGSRPGCPGRRRVWAGLYGPPPAPSHNYWLFDQNRLRENPAPLYVPRRRMGCGNR